MIVAVIHVHIARVILRHLIILLALGARETIVFGPFIVFLGARAHSQGLLVVALGALKALVNLILGHISCVVNLFLGLLLVYSQLPICIASPGVDGAFARYQNHVIRSALDLTDVFAEELDDGLGLSSKETAALEFNEVLVFLLGQGFCIGDHQLVDLIS